MRSIFSCVFLFVLLFCILSYLVLCDLCEDCCVVAHYLVMGWCGSTRTARMMIMAYTFLLVQIDHERYHNRMFTTRIVLLNVSYFSRVLSLPLNPLNYRLLTAAGGP